MKTKFNTTLKIFFGIIFIIAFILGIGNILGIHSATELTITFQTFIAQFGVWSVVIYIVVSAIGTIILSVIPGVSMAFILVGVGLFGASWQTFLICASSVFLSSLVMYLLGRTGGYKLFIKIIGSDNLKRATDLIRNRGQIYFPLMMAVGGFPDDALVCVAGITKMNLWFFLPSVVIGRSVGIATIVFGIELIPFASFNTFYEWFVFGACVIAYVFAVIKLGNIINKKIGDKLK